MRSALDVWVRLGRRAGAHTKMFELAGGCQSGEGLPVPGCFGAVGMYPSPATCFPQVVIFVHAAHCGRGGASMTFSRLGLPLRLSRAADSADNCQQASPALAPWTMCYREQAMSLRERRETLQAGHCRDAGTAGYYSNAGFAGDRLPRGLLPGLCTP
jgi:hypothetical protein